jgi:hypothetical protein
MWQDNLALALRHISRRGGPTAILSEPTQGCDRRFLLEQLAVADLFSELTASQVQTQLLIVQAHLRPETNLLF